MLKITIPTPCHQDWQSMTPNENGRHCAACCKTVVDFTSMTDEELHIFFLSKKEKTCGIFKNEQLHRTELSLPQNIFNVQMPWWKRFLVASLIVFGATLFSCDTSISEERNKEESSTGLIVVNPVVTPPPPPTAGMIDIKWMSKQYPDTVCGVTKGNLEILPIEPERLFVGKHFISSDTLNCNISDQVSKQDTTMVLPNTTPDSSFIKNPPKADSIKCDDVPIIYSQTSIKNVPRSTTSPSPGL